MSYEDFMDINSFIGPWTHEFSVDGETVVVGYEAPTMVEYPSRWDAEWEGHQEFEDSCAALERRLNRAIKKERRELLSRLILWIANAPLGCLGENRRKFWRRVLSSRRHCSLVGGWSDVYLTKEQVDLVFEVFSYRMNGGNY